MTVFGSGAQLPASKIMQYRVDVYNADGTIGNYRWSQQPANALGQVDLISLAELGAPVNTVAPAVTPTSGASPQTLSVTNGTWTGNPTITYTYQWVLGGSNIGGATSSTYNTTGAGSYACKVTATNGVGSSVATSNTATIT